MNRSWCMFAYTPTNENGNCYCHNGELDIDFQCQGKKTLSVKAKKFLVVGSILFFIGAF